MQQHIAWPYVPQNKVPRLSVEDDGVEALPMHCAGCGHFLGYQAIIVGFLKLKCRYCKQWNTIDIIPPSVIIEDEVEEASRLTEDEVERPVR